MRVGVHWVPYVGVPEQGLHYFRVLAPLEQSRAERVAQAVEGELVAYSFTFHHRFIPNSSPSALLGGLC